MFIPNTKAGSLGGSVKTGFTLYICNVCTIIDLNLKSHIYDQLSFPGLFLNVYEFPNNLNKVKFSVY